MWEEANNIVEVDCFVFLQKSDNVSFATRLNEVLEIPGLGIIDFKFWFDLTNSEHRVKFSNSDHIFTILFLHYAAEEVCSGRLVKEYWCIVHLVLKDTQSLEVLQIHLTKQVKFVSLSFEDQFTIRTNMS